MNQCLKDMDLAACGVDTMVQIEVECSIYENLSQQEVAEIPLFVLH